MERATVRVNGVVQSVGFRPFVYRRATTHDVRGTVRNLGDAGVRIELEGPSDAIDAVIDDLRQDPPPLASVDTVDVDRRSADTQTFDSFDIVESGSNEGSGDATGGTIPPDTAICAQCLADVRDPDSRYYDYWATSCVDCGPRFTVVESLPYDRPTTSMASFPLCADCDADYEDPADRRYHAQTIACPQCGPTLRYGRPSDRATESSAIAREAGRDPFPDALTELVDGAAAVRAAADSLAAGETVVLKGIGGAHLACDATNPEAVERLRERTDRPAKPFAVMAPDVETAASFADLSAVEREHLQSPRRPILLVDRKRPAETGTANGAVDGTANGVADGTANGVADGTANGVAASTSVAAASVAPAVAPGLHTVGVMLPYSGVHHLLFDHVDGPLVMTSANLPGRPMHTENGAIVEALADVADGFLLHDRRIVARCDDSLARVVDGERRLIRRSRGVAPTPVPMQGAGDAAVLGVGPELDVTPGVLHDGDCYLTQYVGDVDGLETFDYFRAAIDHLLDVTGLPHPAVVAHDAHPAFNTTDYVDRLVEAGDVERAVSVQHHHAHAASVLAEHGRERAIGLTLDGVGYGPDGTVWGGEVLDASRADYERVGGLAPVPMPGGDRATEHPSRLVAGLVHANDPDEVATVLDRHDVAFPDGGDERSLVRQQLDAGINSPETSSAGRFLDAVSALLGVCTERSYEGEPAMKLEALAVRGTPRPIDVPHSTVDGRPVVDTPRLFAALVDLLEAGASRATVAATAQDALAHGLADVAVAAAKDRDRDAVVLSGGVAYNDHIAGRIRERVTEAGLTFLANETVPPGDGGVAYGQAAVAAARSSE